MPGDTVEFCAHFETAADAKPASASTVQSMDQTVQSVKLQPLRALYPSSLY